MKKLKQTDYYLHGLILPKLKYVNFVTSLYFVIFFSDRYIYMPFIFHALLIN